MDASAVGYSDLPEGFSVAPGAAPAAAPVSAPAAAPAAPAFSDLPQGFSVAAPPPAEKGFSDRLKDDVTSIGDEAVKKRENPNLNDLGRAAIDAQTGLNAMWSVPKEGVVSAYNSLPDSVKGVASAGTKEAKEIAVKGWMSLPEGARNEIASDAGAAHKWVSSLIYDHPNVAGVLGVAASVAPADQVVKGVAAAAPIVADAVEKGVIKGIPATYKFGKDMVEDLKAPVAPQPGDPIPPPKFDPADVHKALSTSYGKALAQSKQYYNDARDIGTGLDVPVDDLRKHLDSVIGEIADDPLHEGKSALSDLKRIRAKIGDPTPSSIIDQYGKPIARQLPDTATATDLLDIKQFLNENFNPKRFAERSDNPYTNLSKVVKQGLSDVGDMHPPFADAVKTADKFWVNGVDMPYRNNSVLHRFWNPEDYNAQKSVDRGMADKLPEATRERQYNMLKKINNPIEFEALKKSLPKEAQQQFADAVSDYIKTDAGADLKSRGKNLLKGLYHVSDPLGIAWGRPLTGVKEIGKALEPGMTKEQADILKAAQGKPYARGGVVVDKAPTPAQKVAGNYRKHHIKIHGLDISIENPKGSERTGESKDGKKWKSVMPDHYGYIKRTQGADGDHVDVYVGENERSNRVYVVDQKEADTGKFDEHKCFLGFSNREDAEKSYSSSFSDGRGRQRIGHIRRMSVAEFKKWLKTGNTRAPVKNHKEDVV